MGGERLVVVRRVGGGGSGGGVIVTEEREIVVARSHGRRKLGFGNGVINDVKGNVCEEWNR